MNTRNPRPLPAQSHHALTVAEQVEFVAWRATPEGQSVPPLPARKRQTHKSSAEGKRQTLAYRAARQAKRFTGEV